MSLPCACSMRLGILVVLLGTLAGPNLQAADSPNETLKLTTDRVVVFKDGYYLAVKRGTAVTNGRGELHLFDVPENAVLGSVWATATGGTLRALVASREDVEHKETVTLPCTQTIEVLQANLGKSAQLVLTDKSVVQGEILRVLTEPTVGAPSPGLASALGLTDQSDGADAPATSRSGTRLAGATSVSSIAGSHFLLRTTEGDMLLQVSQIQWLLIRDMKSTLDRTVTTVTSPKRLTLRFAEPETKVEVSFLYFQPGLRWIPTYRIQLGTGEQKLATVDLQAEFLNEAEDLAEVPVDIVVGVPNFRFKDTPSPLILEQALRNALAQAAPHLMGQQLSNASFQARSGERFREPVEPAAVPDLPPELGAVGAQDLFVYSLKSLTLKKGERAAVPLFSSQVPYRSVYTWDVHLTRSDVENVTGPGKNRSPQVISENQVWHQIVLTNTTRVPWTTGAALLMQDGRPLAQDLLTYTSIGSEVRVPVTISVDTQGTTADEEVERTLKALSMHGLEYAKIDKLSNLRLMNRKSVPIDVEITFRTGGRATEASDEGKITLNAHSPGDWIDYRGHSAVNNSSRVVWRTRVAPGGVFSPSVKYSYYTRH